MKEEKQKQPKLFSCKNTAEFPSSTDFFKIGLLYCPVFFVIHVSLGMYYFINLR